MTIVTVFGVPYHWMRLALRELAAALGAVLTDPLRVAFKVPMRILRDKIRFETHAADHGCKRGQSGLVRSAGNRDTSELNKFLVGFNDHFHYWRSNQVTAMGRAREIKRRISGTPRAQSLHKMLEVEISVELWHLRTTL